MGKRLLISAGLISGHLTAISNNGMVSGFQTWLCLCDCGKQVIIRAAELTSGKRTSCGHTRRPKNEDLTGQIFGKWKVLDSERINRRVLCRCVCGREKLVLASQITTGLNRQCRRCAYESFKNRFVKGAASKNAILKSYKRQARVRGYIWALTDEDFDRISFSSCFYCGIAPSNEYASGNNGSFVYNGIDRVDNSRGYELDNVVSCCKTCNQAKSAMTQQEFLDWVKRVYAYSLQNALLEKV